MVTPTLGSKEAALMVSDRIDPLIDQLLLGWMKFETHPKIQLSHYMAQDNLSSSGPSLREVRWRFREVRAS